MPPGRRGQACGGRRAAGAKRELTLDRVASACAATRRPATGDRRSRGQPSMP